MKHRSDQRTANSLTLKAVSPHFIPSINYIGSEDIKALICAHKV